MVTMTMGLREFNQYKEGCAFYCKDGRMLLYLGRSIDGKRLFAWVDCIMAIDKMNRDPEYLNLELVKSRLEVSINSLIKSDNLLIGAYKTLPNLVDCVGDFSSMPIVQALIKKYSVSVKAVKENREKRNSLQLKKGYIYKKVNVSFTEEYLYLGYQTVQIESIYNVNSYVRKVHLFMYVTEEDKRDLQESFKYRVRFGYDGNFSINFKKADLKEVGFGMEVNLDPNQILFLGRGR